MRISKELWRIGLVFLTLSSSVLAADPSGQIHLKPGEMGFLNFLEMVSERLDLQIDASGIGPSFETVVVPDTGPLSSDHAKALVLSALYLQGYTWIHDTSTDLYRVMRQRDARDQETPMVTEVSQLPDSDLLVTYVMAIEHTSPEYISRILRSFMPANSRIVPDDATRSVLITDSARNISKLRKIVERVDTPKTAKQAAEWLAALSKNADAPCPTDRAGVQPVQPAILIALFSLIALVIGFLIRGYAIRRIEGGL